MMVCRSTRNVCVKCKTVSLVSNCGHETILVVNSKWRAPKKSNRKAWKEIAAGNIWWDHKAIDCKAIESRMRWNEIKFRGKEAIEEAKVKRVESIIQFIKEALEDRAAGPPACYCCRQSWYNRMRELDRYLALGYKNG